MNKVLEPLISILHLFAFPCWGFKKVVPCASELTGVVLALIPYSKWSVFLREQLKEVKHLACVEAVGWRQRGVLAKAGIKRWRGAGLKGFLCQQVMDGH